jgi:predicted dehydrogenase
LIENIAIIGLGSIGRRHLRLAREFRSEIKIIAVRSGKGGEVPEEKIADKIVYNIKDAMDIGIQAAVISTPAVYHIKQAKKLMEADIHVLVEKPLSHNMENIDDLLKIAENSTAVGLVGYCLRYDPGAIKFKEMLDSNELGKILRINVDCGSYLPDWRPNQDYHQSVSAKKELGGGVLLELSHDLDYICWFFGNIETVSAVLQNSGNLNLNVEDNADLILKTVEGLTISLHLDFNSRNIRRHCNVKTSNGTLIWDAISKQVIWRPTNGPEKVESFNHDKDEIYRQQLKHFFKCIENDQTPIVSLYDGIAVLQIVEATRRSNEIGRAVALA